MKTPAENFLNELNELMPEHPYKHRWIKELNDHLHDLEDDLHRENRPLSSLTLTTRMGNPKHSIADFYKKLHPWRALYYWGEALLTGILLLFLSVMTWPLHAFFLGIMDWIVGQQETPMDNSVLLNMLGRALLVGGIWFFAHFIGWKEGYKNQKETGMSMIPWGILMIAPFLILEGVWLTNIFDASDNALYSDKETLALILGLGLLVCFNVSISLLARAVALRKKQPQRKNTPGKWPKSAKWGAVLTGFYLISYGILRTGGSYMDLPSFFNLAPSLFYIFFPLTLLEFMGMLLIGMVVQNDAGLFPLAILFVKLTGWVLLFIAAQSLLHMVYKKTFSWPRLGLMVYTLSLLCVNPTYFEPKLEWNAKSVQVISNTIEKKQFGLFYQFFKHGNQDESQLFRYAVDFQEGEFILQQNTGKEFHFRPE